METMVYFVVEGRGLRPRQSEPRPAGETIKLVADLNHMHLIDPATGLVI